MEALKARILSEGQNLGRGILKIDSFLNHQLDADLMEAIGSEIARQFADTNPTRIVTAEVSGTGYTAGGKTLTTKTITQDNPNDRAVFDADDSVWTLLTTTTNAAVIYKDSGSPATSPLLAYIEFDQEYSPAGVDFTIEWDAAGIFTLGE